MVHGAKRDQRADDVRARDERDHDELDDAESAGNMRDHARGVRGDIARIIHERT